MTKEREKNLIERAKENCYYLNHISEEEQTDEVIDSAMVKSVWAFSLIKDDSKKTVDRCLMAVRYSRCLINYVPDELKDMVLGLIKKEREEYLIRMVKDDWFYIGSISEEEQTDRVIDAAMDGSILAFKWIKDESKKTYERCVKAVRGFRHSEFLLQSVPEEMRNNILKSFRHNEFLLDDLPEELRDNFLNGIGL